MHVASICSQCCAAAPSCTTMGMPTSVESVRRSRSSVNLKVRPYWYKRKGGEIACGQRARGSVDLSGPDVAERHDANRSRLQRLSIVAANLIGDFEQSIREFVSRALHFHGFIAGVPSDLGPRIIAGPVHDTERIGAV